MLKRTNFIAVIDSMLCLRDIQTWDAISRHG